MEESDFLTPGVSKRLTHAGELPLWDVLAVCHSVVPLFFFSVIENKSDFLGIRRYKYFVVTPDLETKFYIKGFEEEEIKNIIADKMPLNIFLDAIWEEPLLRGYFTKNNFFKDHLHIVGYPNEKQFYKDYFLFYDEIPDI